MCGICGAYSSGQLDSHDRDVIARMGKTLEHRGPDAGAEWTDNAAGIMLGHRRLAIVDLTAAGAQPMTSVDSRLTMVYNGEIYNHLDLRSRLGEEGLAPTWLGHSDSETLLACFSAWGIKETLQSALGMFAIALWDARDRTLTLARDRLGEKPLYYGIQNGVLLFGSELKALQQHPAFAHRIDRDALALLLRHNCIPAPYSIFEGVRKLPPAHLVTLARPSAGALAEPEPYWSLNGIASAALKSPFLGDDQEATVEMETRLLDTVRGQLMSDVPLGAFLSGGIDSSTIVALMQANSSTPIRTFTIGSLSKQYNEAQHAKAIARHLGTEHTELYVTPEDALEVIPQLPSAYCEPFGDSSQIPTFLVSALASQHVRVALSGDGGDEVFGGYNRYLTAHRVWSRASQLPRPVRAMAARAILTGSPASWDTLFHRGRAIVPRRFRVNSPGDKLHKLAGVLASPTGRDYYRTLTSHWDNPADVVIGATEPKTLVTDPEEWLDTDDLEHWMMALDSRTYLPDDILVKVDRAAMAHSLETRVPFLDHRVIEFAWSLPLEMKIRGGQGKWILREVLDRHVPRELTDRPKMGFGIPLGEWLRGPLRDWAEALLDESRLKREGYFRPTPIRRMWREHLERKRPWQHHLWTILMFQAWLEDQPSAT